MTITQGTQLGRYRLLSLLGAGGMAEVWKAKIEGPAGFERTVVVKRVLSHLGRDAAFVEMFLAEAKLSALLAHPNIVQVHELGQEQGEFFMAMEYVNGCDLGGLLRRRLALPIGFGVMVAQAICRALGYAHALRDEAGTPLGLVHRDVSPANIMLGREGTVKLLDFGIAKALGSAEHRTQTGTLKGKLGYMSPEQVDGQPIDHRSDLFAVGVVLHELLTGERLFKAASEFLTLSLMRAAVVRPPSQLNPAIPPALEAICLRALARDPAARFGSGDEMADALEPFLDGWNTDRVRRMMEELVVEQQAADAVIGPTLTGEAPPGPPTLVATSVDTIPVGRAVPGRSARPRRIRWWLVASAAAITLGVAGFAIQHTTRAPAPAPAPAPAASSPAETAATEITSSAPTPTTPTETAPTVPAPSETAPTENAPTETAPEVVAPAVPAVPPAVVAPPVAAKPVTRPTQRKRPQRSASPSRATRRKPATGTPKPAIPEFDPESALP